MAVELATGYVSLVPSMQGAEGQIAGILTPAATGAGTTAGAAGGTAMGASMRTRLLAALGPAALAAGIAASFTGLYRVGGIFDDVTDTIRTGTGASGEALDALVDSSKSVASQVPANYESVGTTIADVNTRMGLTGETLETVSSQYLEAGRILGEEIDVQSTSAAFNAFGIEGENVTGAMDSLFQVSQATGVSMNDLASQVQSNAPAVQALGFSFDETAGLVGNLDKAGLNSSRMMMGMSQSLVRLAEDGEEPADAFRRTVDEIDGFLAAGDSAAAIDLAGEVFGTRNATQFIGAIQDGTLAMDDLAGVAGMTEDTILGVGDETMDFAEQWQLVKNNALAALEPLGSAVFATLGDSLEGLVPYLQDFSEWAQENPGVIKGVAIGLGVLATALGIAAAAQWVMNSALLASPITWIIVGIAALIAGLVLLIANWDTVVAFLKDVWGNVVDWLAGVWDSITAGIESAWNGISTYFTNTWNSIQSFFQGGIDLLKNMFSNAWDSVSNTVTSKWNGIVNWIKGVPQRFLNGLSRIGELGAKIGGYVQGARDAAVDKFNGLVSWVGNLPGRILSALGNVGSLLSNAGRQIIDGFLNGLKSAWGNVTSWVGGVGDWIANNKGPKEYDLALLVPAGRWIMQGLQEGMQSEVPNLERTLSGVSDSIRGTRFAPPAAGAGAGSSAAGMRLDPRDLDYLADRIGGSVLAGADRVTTARMSQQVNSYRYAARS